MSSKEISEWGIYFSLEPWGEERQDMKFGQLCALIANAVTGKKGRTFKPEDFLLKTKADEKPAWQEMLTQIEGLNASMGGRDLRDR